MNTEKLDLIIDLAEELKDATDEPVAPEQEVWTDEYISMLVSGTPDLHIRNPKQFAKMAPYADPDRDPFTASTWFTTGWGGRDARPLKAVEIDGKFYRRVPKSIEPDWYAVAKRCVVDVTETPWLVPVNAPLSPSRKQMIANCAAYRGGFNQPLNTWPDDLRAALEVA